FLDLEGALPVRERSCFASCRVEFLGECCAAEQVEDALQVVCHGGEPDFDLCAAGASQQQSGMAEDTVLERGEGMLDGGAPKLHGLGRGAGMHAVERVFVEQSGHQPLWSLGTARLQSASAAVGLAGCVVDGLVLLRDLFALKRLACRAETGVGLRLVAECGAV